ncbi:T9SS type A sorting domain-containing protein [Flavobacterium subsaxonicum]|uniref:Secretion system C-terminal sorting domain-containing protein n=1 Tax=Flavobacterium subsaxonicum WB 4.1-42 = DSM 21790 TaxID=1121898 RepID=A0A0A2MIB1_9FLAO|nr:T9SS type A sorting domain-containing protein [Flavobacterium subsaxonicum]KGO92387.1 hypothetical protein Q766_13055 [Flavobacterium subsaxonicum WB 4.1-42 = DSM 21790]
MRKITIFFALLFNVFVYAQSFSLDPTFSDNGVKINSDISYTPKDVLLINNNYYFISYNKVAKVSYGGTLDTNFGNDGFITLENGGNTFEIKGFKNIGDYLYVFGQATNTSGNKNIFFCKIDMDGSFDSSFGTNGFAIIDFNESEVLNDFTTDASGNLFCIGQNGSATIYFKIMPSGSLLTTFDALGYKIAAISSGKKIFSYGLNFLIVGTNFDELAISQIDPSGNLVTTYGTNGIVTSPLITNFVSQVVQAELIGTNLYVNSFHSWSFNAQESRLQKFDINTGSVLSTFTNNYKTYFQIKNNSIYITGADRCDIGTCTRDYKLTKQSLNGNSEPQNTINYSYNFPALLWSDDVSGTVFVDDNGKISLAGTGKKSYFIEGQPVYEWGFAMIRLVEGPLSLNDVSTKTASVYPNPFNDFVTVESGSQIKDIQVMDVSGRVISNPNFTTEGETARVNLETLQQNGMYLMQVTTTDDKTFTKKIIKQ